MGHRLVSTLEACELLHVSRSTFLRLQSTWTDDAPVPFPHPARATAHQYLWSPTDLRKWKRKHRRWRYAGIFRGTGSELLTATEIVTALAITPQRLRTYRNRDDFPTPVERVGKSSLWTRKSIRDWVLTAAVVSQTDLLPKQTDWR